MKLIVKHEEIYELEKKILVLISNINSEFSKIEELKSSLLWEGFAHNTFMNKYDEILLEEKKRISKLEKLINFLDDVLLNYGMAIDDIKNEYHDVSEGDDHE